MCICIWMCMCVNMNVGARALRYVCCLLQGVGVKQKGSEAN